jgi:hypothetical protein
MELNFDDLFVTCENCGGTGRVQQPSTTQGSGYGRTVTTIYTGGGDCDACQGTGGMLTETGKAIARLFDKLTYKPLLVQIARDSANQQS